MSPAISNDGAPRGRSKAGKGQDEAHG
jgi:hypothetical protein